MLFVVDVVIVIGVGGGGREASCCSAFKLDVVVGRSVILLRGYLSSLEDKIS